MRTTREQKEANTVHTIKAQANLKPVAQRWLERNYPWSQPSCGSMSFRLGISYATGSGLVPV